MENNYYMPEPGETAEFSDGGTNWCVRTFYAYIPTDRYPYKCGMSYWKLCRKIPTVNETKPINQTNKSFMSTLKQQLKNIMRTEPSKTFVKVGFMDSNEDITETGKEALQIILWDKYQTELKELADTLNVEEK